MPERAVHLDGPVEHALQHPGDVELDERDLDARGLGALAVDLGRRRRGPSGARR
jgi:hypothetical protein